MHETKAEDWSTGINYITGWRILETRRAQSRLPITSWLDTLGMTFLYILGVRSRPNLTAGARKTWGSRDLRPTLADRLRKCIPWGRQIPPYIWTDACYLPPWIFRNAKKPRPDLKISPHHVAAQGSTTERVLVHFGHQHKRCIFDHITEHCTTPIILNTGRVQSKCIAQFDGKRGGMKTQAKRLMNLIDSNLQ